jgi:hypothetical protein
MFNINSFPLPPFARLLPRASVGVSWLMVMGIVTMSVSVSMFMSMSVMMIIGPESQLISLDSAEDGKAVSDVTLEVHLVEGTGEKLSEVITGRFLWWAHFICDDEVRWIHR